MARRFRPLQLAVAVIIGIMVAIIFLNLFITAFGCEWPQRARLVITSLPNSRAQSYTRQIDRILITLAEA